MPPPGTMQCKCGCRDKFCPQVCSTAIIPNCTPPLKSYNHITFHVVIRIKESSPPDFHSGGLMCRAITGFLFKVLHPETLRYQNGFVVICFYFVKTIPKHFANRDVANLSFI
jgi:hypothetical protein